MIDHESARHAVDSGEKLLAEAEWLFKQGRML
jgi:hypothetical protein